MALVPPAERDGFSFSHGDLYAESSGHNRHRRATLAELEAHFGSGSDRDHPAHWFEAQLLHYGLPPSKTKAVARMRLYDAVRAGSIAVPPHVRALETELKKQWTKNEREAKKALGGGGSSNPAKKGATTTGTKRKAGSETVDLTVSVGGVDIKVSKSTKSAAAESSKGAAPAAKKAKTTKSTTTTSAAAAAAATKATTPKAKPAAKATATSTTKPKAPASTAASKSKAKAPSSSAASATTPAKKQTARRGGLSQGPGRGGSSSSSTATTTTRAPRTKQTARRGGGFMGRPPPRDDDDAPPPPYSELPEPYYNGGGGGYNGYSDSDHDDDDDGDDGDELRPLGLLNGRYAVYSSDVTSEWDHWTDSDFELELTLAGGNELWGRFDIGVVHGVIRLAERPYASSHDCCHFTWRGREHEGPMMYGDGNGGWFRFLGGGRVEGCVDFMRLGFRAERLPEHGTNVVGIGELRAEWNGYNAREYEEENRARWR